MTTPVCLSFVIRVSPPLLEPVKAALVGAVCGLENGDCVHVSHPRHPGVSERVGEAVGRISNYTPDPTHRLAPALREAVRAATGTGWGTRRYVFLIFDRYDVAADDALSEATSDDARLGGDCTFVLCGLGPNYDPSLPHAAALRHGRCIARHSDTADGLASLVQSYGSTDPTDPEEADGGEGPAGTTVPVFPVPGGHPHPLPPELRGGGETRAEHPLGGAEQPLPGHAG